MATQSGGTPAPVNGDRAAPLNTPTSAPVPQSVPPPPVGALVSHDRATPIYSAHSVAARLFEEGFAFDFFQAVRLLERLAPQRSPVGRAGPPQAEVVRFRAHLSLSFPPSSIYEIQPPSAALPVPAMTVAFMGLTGPSGILPQHYTELLLRLERDGKGLEKTALRAWLDLFNHRLLSLFWRAWEKYRFSIHYERGEYRGREPDAFTQVLFSLVGLGLPPLRNRLRVGALLAPPTMEREGGGCRGEAGADSLARIDDVSLLHYSGFFAHRPRCAASLEALLRDYFGFDVQVRQFQGQWLYLDVANQSRLGAAGGNCRLGVDLVAGARVWDVQGKFRVRIGPLSYVAFNEFLPDRSPVSSRKALFLLIHLVRLYVGPELDFDVQLVLRAEEVPECRMTRGASGDPPRLGWNTWIRSQAMSHDAADAVFAGEEEVWMNESKH